MIETLDMNLDERIKLHLTDVDWSKVTEEDAVSLGLALGMYKEHRAELARIASMSSTLGNVTIGVALMSAVLLALNVPAAVVLFAVVLQLLLRTAWFSWRERVARKELAIVEELTIDAAREFSEKPRVADAG